MMGVLWRLFGPLHRASMSCQAPTSERHCESNRSCIHRSHRPDLRGETLWARRCGHFRGTRSRRNWALCASFRPQAGQRSRGTIASFGSCTVTIASRASAPETAATHANRGARG